MALWLITGGAGFIGSHLVAQLVSEGESVQVLDDFTTGKPANLEGHEQRVNIIRGSICDPACLKTAMEGVDYCLHQAALPSVPRSIQDPERTHLVNVTGTLQVLLAARDASVRRVVMASSSSVYGPDQPLPVQEGLALRPISPYAVSKLAAELYAETFAPLYGLEVVALRYFNVFGPRQDPAGPYAAVIPRFIEAALAGRPLPVHGSGEQGRDFTYVENVVGANLRAARFPEKLTGAFNVGCGASVTLLEVVRLLETHLGQTLQVEHQPQRAGDILRSWADIARARESFGYVPRVSFEEGMRRTLAWYQRQ